MCQTLRCVDIMHWILTLCQHRICDAFFNIHCSYRGKNSKEDSIGMVSEISVPQRIRWLEYMDAYRRYIAKGEERRDEREWGQGYGNGDEDC